MPQADASNTTTLPYALPPQLAAQELRRQKALAELRVLRKTARAEIDRLIAFLDASDLDPDLEPEALEDAGEDETGGDNEPSLGFSTGGFLPELHRQEGRAFHANADAGRELEEQHDGAEPGEDAEPDVDDEHSLGWGTGDLQTGQWSIVTDLEEGVGPVRKKRPASKTGNRVLVGVEVF